MERRKGERRRVGVSDRPFEERRRAEQRRRIGTPRRIAPSADPAETIERLVPRKQVRQEPGDVLVTREALPRLQPSATAARWWFRVSVYPATNDGRVFTSFHHAAVDGEQLAAQRRARLLFVEDGMPTLLNDYRS